MMASKTTSTVNWFVVLSFIVIFVSIPTVVVIICSYALGFSSPMPVWQAILWALLITPTAIILGRVVGFFLRLLFASAGVSLKLATVLVGIMEFGIFWMAYELLFDNLLIGFSMAASTMLFWGAVNTYLNRLEEKKGVKG